MLESITDVREFLQEQIHNLIVDFMIQDHDPRAGMSIVGNDALLLKDVKMDVIQSGEN